MKRVFKYQNSIVPSCSSSFGLYFYKTLYPKLTEISRNRGRKEENACAILGSSALSTAKVLAPVSFLSYCFPRKPFRKVKSSKLAACSYPATAQVERGHRIRGYALLRDWASRAQVVLPRSRAAAALCLSCGIRPGAA